MRQLCATFLITILLVAIVYPQSTNPQPSAASPDSIRPNLQYQAAARSVLLPGWGQFYNKQPNKGMGMVLAETAFIGSAATCAMLSNMVEGDNVQYALNIGKAYSLWALGSAIVISGVDAYTSAAPEPKTGKNPLGAMLRSIFVPGWGQFYNEKPFKAVLIGGTQVVFVTNALIFDKWAQDATVDVDKLYYEDNRSLYYWLLGASILYSMTDAFVDAHLYDFDETPDLALACNRWVDPSTGLQSQLWKLSLAIHF